MAAGAPPSVARSKQERETLSLSIWRRVAWTRATGEPVRRMFGISSLSVRILFRYAEFRSRSKQERETLSLSIWRRVAWTRATGEPVRRMFGISSLSVRILFRYAEFSRIGR